jgi:hypothetical protein
MPITSIITKKGQVVYVNFDDGTQLEFHGSADEFKAYCLEQAAQAKERYASLMAIAEGAKTEPDITKSPAIGKDIKIDPVLEAKGGG